MCTRDDFTVSAREQLVVAFAVVAVGEFGELLRLVVEAKELTDDSQRFSLATQMWKNTLYKHNNDQPQKMYVCAHLRPCAVSVSCTSTKCPPGI